MGLMGACMRYYAYSVPLIGCKVACRCTQQIMRTGHLLHTAACSGLHHEAQACCVVQRASEGAALHVLDLIQVA
jgi:hypothetical protein